MKDKKNIALIIITAIMVLAIALIIIISPKPNNQKVNIDTVDQNTPVVVKETSTSVVKVEKEITSKIIEDGLKNMGVLLCEKYYFTEVVSYSSVKEFLNIKLPFTESEYLASYDGVVTAGIDFNNVKVNKDDAKKKIIISLPKSEIQNIDIDTKSFKLYNEQYGLGNPVSIEDFNLSLVQLEDTAKNKAIEKGILERSDENARKMINSFVSGLVDLTEYTIEFTSI